MKAKLISESLFRPKSIDEIYKLLSSMSDQEKSLLMYDSCSNGDLKMVQLLVDAGINVNMNPPEPFKWSFLMIASKAKLQSAAVSESVYNEIVKILIDNGAYINFQDKVVGYTALMVAVSNNNREIIETLLKAGADLNLKTTAHSSALTLANTAKTLIILKKYMNENS